MGRVPVLVATGAVSQRFEEPTAGFDLISLMRKALDEAARPLRKPGSTLIEEAELAMVPAGLWAISDPARLVLGERATQCKTAVAHIGVLQQSVLTRAVQAVASGEATSAIVVGGETKYRALRATIAGVELPAIDGADDGSPDEVLVPAAEVITALEIARGLAVPAHQYALLESALAHGAGRSPEAQREVVSRIVATMSEVAASNPSAWNQHPMSAEAIRLAAPVALPYTKPCCSQWNVDQAAALIFTTEEHALDLGIDPSNFIYPVAAAESNLMVPVTERAALDRSRAAQLVGTGLEEASGIQLSCLDLLELYSCFPAAVQIQANEFGIDLTTQPFTVTGGMHFAGGPLNNFCLQTLVRLAELLRAGAGRTAALTAVSGMFTKFGASVWSRDRPTIPFSARDVTNQARRETETRTIDGGLCGEVVVVAATRTAGHDAQSILLGERDGIRSLATTADPTIGAAVEAGIVGSTIMVDGADVVSLVR